MAKADRGKGAAAELVSRLLARRKVGEVSSPERDAEDIVHKVFNGLAPDAFRFPESIPARRRIAPDA